MHKKLFLIDGIGAIVSALMLGVVLVKFQYLIGLPVKVLYSLSIIPCFFAIYSISCFYFLHSKWKLYLKIIAYLNLLYCFVTISLVFYFYENLKFLGVLYFILEIVVIIYLVTLEIKSANKYVN